MYMIIKNIKAPFNDDGIVTTLVNDILKPKLKAAAIKFKVEVSNDAIVFNTTDTNKIFISDRENKIMLAADDKRIASLGRNYLVSNRLTEKQFKLLNRIFNDSFDKLGVSADITIESDKDIHVLREGVINMAWPVPKSFPTEG